MNGGGIFHLVRGCLYSVLITLGMLPTVTSSGAYFEGCSYSSGAKVVNVSQSFSIGLSQFIGTSAAENSQCSILLQAQHVHSKFLVQFEHFAFQRILKSSLACDDSFQIRRDSSLQTVNETPFFSSHGIVLQDSGMFYTSGRCIVLTVLADLWNTVSDAIKPHITLTAIVQEPFCVGGVHRRCNNGDCISSSLFCDGLLNCASSEDEASCSRNISSPNLPPSPDNNDNSDDSIDSKNEFYTWMILLGIVLFLALLIIWMFNRHPQPSQSYNMGRAGVSSCYQTLSTSRVLLLALLSSKFCATLVSAVSPSFSPTVGSLPSFSGDSAAGHVTRDPGYGDDSPQNSGSNYVNKLDYISIAVICSIIALCFLICIIVGWRRKKHHTPEDTMESPSITDGESRTVEVRGERADRQPVRPDEVQRGDSPPPTYSIIERQTSFTSYVSQTSSQFEIPPDYEESWDSTDTGPSNRRRPGSRSSHGSVMPEQTVVSMIPSGSRGTKPVRSESVRGRTHPKSKTFRTTSDTGRARHLRITSRPPTVSEDEDMSQVTGEVVSEISGLTTAVMEDITEQSVDPPSGRQSAAQPLLSSGGAAATYESSGGRESGAGTHVVSIEAGSQSQKLTLV